jgi:hypothetical protein
MDAPTCPGCGEPLARVLDLPYGYWQWDGERYKLSSTSTRVDVAPWACAGCLTELRDFHPQNDVVPG